MGPGPSEGAARAEPSPPGQAQGRPRIDGSDLFAGTREVVIVHQGQEYRLRITRAGKLILTK